MLKVSPQQVDNFEFFIFNYFDYNITLNYAMYNEFIIDFQIEIEYRHNYSFYYKNENEESGKESDPVGHLNLIGSVIFITSKK